MKRIVITLVVIALAVTAVAARKGHDANVGPGPRTSAQGLYIVTLQGAASLKPRTTQSMQFTVVDTKGQAVSDAVITADAPPTRPRVTETLGGGWYEISGLRYDMGSRWELKLTITTAAGTDTVTFDLQQ